MTESKDGEFRFRICKAKGCRNGTTLEGGWCSLCRRKKEREQDRLAVAGGHER